MLAAQGPPEGVVEVHLDGVGFVVALEVLVDECKRHLLLVPKLIDLLCGCAGKVA